MSRGLVALNPFIDCPLPESVRVLEVWEDVGEELNEAEAESDSWWDLEKGVAVVLLESEAESL